MFKDVFSVRKLIEQFSSFNLLVFNGRAFGC